MMLCYAKLGKPFYFDFFWPWMFFEHCSIPPHQQNAFHIAGQETSRGSREGLKIDFSLLPVLQQISFILHQRFIEEWFVIGSCFTMNLCLISCISHHSASENTTDRIWIFVLDIFIVHSLFACNYDIWLQNVHTLMS